MSAELDKLKSELKEAQEYSATLAKVITHDLANPVTVIKSYLELINTGRIPPSDIPLTLDKIKQNVASAESIIAKTRREFNQKKS